MKKGKARKKKEKKGKERSGSQGKLRLKVNFGNNL